MRNSKTCPDQYSRTKLWCGLPACTAPSPRCAAKMAAPQLGTANTQGESARRICGAGFQPAHLHRRDVQPRWPHHNWAQPIRRANQHDGFVVRASSLHTSIAEMCSQDGRTTIGHSQYAGRISTTDLWCGLPACTSPSPRCAAKMAAPQLGTANTKGESARRICGAGFQPAHLHRRDVQPRWPHHNWAQPIRRANQHDGFVVRASSLHTSTVEMCSQDGRTTIGHSQYAGRISTTDLWCGLPACTPPPSRCAAKMAAPQLGTANTKGESARRICGAGFQPAHLHRRDVQPRWPHHNWAQPIRRANQHDGFVVRASSLHISTTQPTRPI